MNFLKSVLLALAAAPLALSSGELPPEVTAKFLKAIATSSGNAKVMCGDPALKAALEGQGVTVDSSSPIAWVTSAAEARMQKQFGRLTVTNKRELASLACIIIEEDGGRPKILLNPANLHAAKVQVSDAFLKIAEKI
jgi:hypothetical protein